VNSGATYNIGASDTIDGLSGSGSVTLGANTLTVGGNNQATSNYSGVMSGTGSLVKTGTGTQTLSGANTYTGATNVNNGTLLVNGSTAAGSPVVVANGATLGGAGTVNGTVNVTLNSVTGTGVPPTVQLGLGIGQPSGTDCSATITATGGINTAAPQATGTFGPGIFCVRVFDVGNLFAPAAFNVTIAHS